MKRVVDICDEREKAEEEVISKFYSAARTH